MSEGTVPLAAQWRGKATRPDLLVVSDESLSPALRERVRSLPGVRSAVSLSLASISVAGRSITTAAVDVASYRRFAPASTARVDAVWRAVAEGDVALTHELGRRLGQPLGSFVPLGAGTPLSLRVGAYAVTMPRVDAVVNQLRGEQLGMQPGNAMVVSASTQDLGRLTDALENAVPGRVNVVRLSTVSPTSGTWGAPYLTGGELGQRLGSFTYRLLPNGFVEPDPHWVTAHITTEEVPILGRVTCHREMLPQLRAALTEVRDRGLAATIDAGDYGGCYVPRFIGRDPRNGLSLHTWGIAVDLNVAGNQRGTVGDINRDVVAIFKKWGFAWGGDWRWTDPMHFELAAIVGGTGPR